MVFHFERINLVRQLGPGELKRIRFRPYCLSNMTVLNEIDIRSVHILLLISEPHADITSAA